MPVFASLFSVLMLLFAADAAAAESYVCLEDGRKIYTTNPAAHTNCRPVQRDQRRADTVQTAAAAASAPVAAPTAQAASTPSFEELSALLQQDITIAPIKVDIKPQSKTGTAAALKTPRKPMSEIQAAKIVSLPVPPPSPTRRQILKKEIDREKAALKTAVAGLSTAISKGDTANVKRLSTQVSDRRANIAALEAEMRR